MSMMYEDFNETNGSVFRVDGRKVYCDGHPELPLEEGFLKRLS